MEKVDLYEFGGMTSRSDAMFERRQRILNEARKMMSHGGLESFNMRELSRRAKVAQGTIYYAFGSKEAVMALAIRQYFDSFANNIHLREGHSDFEQALERQLTTTLRQLGLKQFLRAVAALYFSPTIHEQIREVLVEIGGRPYARWVGLLEMGRQLERGVQTQRLLEDISNLQYAKVHEWGMGLLDDDAFVQLTTHGVLLMLLGATRNEARREVRTAFVDFMGKGPLYERLMMEAREAVAALPQPRSSMKNATA